MSKISAQELGTNIPLRKRLAAYRYFLGILWRANRGLAFFRFIFLLLGAALQPIEVYAFSLLIAAITSGNIERAPWLLGIAVSAYGLRHFVSEITYSKVDDWFAKNTQVTAERVILAHVGKLNPEQLLHDEVRRDLDFVREELWRLNQLPGNTEFLLRSLFKLVASLGLAFVAPWWVTALILIDSLFQAVNLGYESHQDLWTAIWNSLEGRRIEYFGRHVLLSGQEFREMRLLDGVGAILKKIWTAGDHILVRFRAMAFRSALSRTFLSAFHIGVYAIIIVILGRAAIADAAALAGLYVAINLFSLLSDALNGVSGSLSRLASDLGILARIHRLLDLPQESKTGLTIPRTPLVIEFRRVSYLYAGALKPALTEINVTFTEGEHLAVVGENGAGKSTFLRLLSGLDKPTSGEIIVNGKPLDSYQPDEWRHAFHLMLQGARLYQDFVRDNLLYGAPPARWKKQAFSLGESVAISGAEQVIDELPAGYDTFVGDWVAPPGINPYQPSGGQQQRLLIARSLIHGARLIGFDEPTSAMDALAETSFFNRLHDAMKEKGLIYISHRFSTVRRASRILVFHEGKLVEDGTHETLIKQKGKYAELYNEQAQWYD